MAGETDWMMFEAVEVAGALVRARLGERVFVASAAQVTKDKGGGHLAHRIDDIAEQALFAALREAGYSGSLFSEEAGVVRFGNSAELLICDPYCNTSLTFRGVRESAMTLYEFDAENLFRRGCISDLQIPRSLRVGPAEGHIWWNGSDRRAICSSETSLSRAAVVVSLLKPNRRQTPPLRLVREAGLLLTIDGGIVALRLCAGEVDVFVDHQTGQPGYEVLAYRLVEECGGTVTDGLGRPIDWSGIASELRVGTVRRQTVVAAANSELHGQVLRLLRSE